jgi:hypothetical protein
VEYPFSALHYCRTLVHFESLKRNARNNNTKQRAFHPAWSAKYNIFGEQQKKRPTQRGIFHISQVILPGTTYP